MPCPDWFHDAKLGIFIHWGPYSVPAWAPRTKVRLHVRRRGGFADNAYAEWYLNTLSIEGSPAARHHARDVRRRYPYDDFGAEFIAGVRGWRRGELGGAVRAQPARATSCR